MNDALTDWNSPAVIALLLLQFGVLLLAGLGVHHLVALRRERAQQNGQLAEQLGRVLTGL